MAPLLHALAPRMGEPIPNEVRLALRRAYYRVAAENTLALDQLTRVCAALSGAAAPLLLVKGAALAETLYRNIALRPFEDLDLVVPPHRLAHCRQALLELGYTARRVEERPGFRLAYSGQEAFLPPQPGGVLVELHWHVVDLPYYLSRVPMDWFWQNTQARDIAGQAILVLNAQANLLSLAAHLALHHRLQGLPWYVDLALLVAQNRDTLDWHEVINTARSFELVTALRATLDRLAGYWPDLPLAEPLHRLGALRPTRTERRIFRLQTALPRSRTLDFYTDLACLPHGLARTRFLLQNLFPQPSYMVPRYNITARWQLPLWYLFRLGDGLLKFARTRPRARQIERDAD